MLLGLPNEMIIDILRHVDTADLVAVLTTCKLIASLKHHFFRHVLATSCARDGVDLQAAFHRMVERGGEYDDRAVKWLMRSGGVDVNGRDAGEWPPICRAAQGGYQRVVDILIKAGAGVDARTPDDWTALM